MKTARGSEPFITINCGAFPNLFWSLKLFGYMKGAFTGANENRQGLFRLLMEARSSWTRSAT